MESFGKFPQRSLNNFYDIRNVLKIFGKVRNITEGIQTSQEPITMCEEASSCDKFKLLDLKF